MQIDVDIGQAATIAGLGILGFLGRVIYGLLKELQTKITIYGENMIEHKVKLENAMKQLEIHSGEIKEFRAFREARVYNERTLKE